MGQPKERSAKKNVFVEKYVEIRSFDGNDLSSFVGELAENYPFDGS